MHKSYGGMCTRSETILKVFGKIYPCTNIFKDIVNQHGFRICIVAADRWIIKFCLKVFGFCLLRQKFHHSISFFWLPKSFGGEIDVKTDNWDQSYHPWLESCTFVMYVDPRVKQITVHWREGWGKLY